MSEQNPEDTPQDVQGGAQDPSSDPADQESTNGADAPENGGDAAEGQGATPDQPSGYIGTLAETDPADPNTIRTADQAAPDGVSLDPADAVIGEVPDKRLNVTKAQTLTETKRLPVEGERYRKGYAGALPDADNRPDLTLSGVTSRDYPDATEGDTGQPAQGE